MKKFSIILIICLFLITPVEAAHHYLWSNTDFAFWIDDQSISNSKSKTWASFTIVCEDFHTGKQKPSTNPIIIYKRNGEWYLSFFHDYFPPQNIEYYCDWWQPWGLKWLLDNGYIEE